MIRALLTILLLAAAVYAAACAALWYFQRSLIYFPQPAQYGDESTRMKFEVDGAQLVVSVRPREGRSAVIYFGGNAEDVSASLPTMSSTFADRAVFLAHYRGYGGSTGSPSEAALQQDALALYDHVARNHPDVTVIGRSLGTGVAIRIAAQRPVARLVLVTPYDSIEDLATAQFPYFPVRWLIKDRFNSGALAPQVKAPTLVIAAERDEVIPGESTERLFQRFAPGVARMEVIPDTGHNTISAHPRYEQLLR